MINFSLKWAKESIYLLKWKLDERRRWRKQNYCFCSWFSIFKLTFQLSFTKICERINEHDHNHMHATNECIHLEMYIYMDMTLTSIKTIFYKDITKRNNKANVFSLTTYEKQKKKH